MAEVLKISKSRDKQIKRGGKLCKGLDGKAKVGYVYSPGGACRAGS